MTEIDYRWRTVSIHGQPDKEQAPWGVRWLYADGDGGIGRCPVLLQDCRWQPLPAPVDEEMPPPEPVKRWVVSSAGMMVREGTRQRGTNTDDLRHLARLANAHDRGDVVWPERLRPMSELPDDHDEWALVVYRSNGWAAVRLSKRQGDDSYGRLGWLPLPDAETMARYLPDAETTARYLGGDR